MADKLNIHSITHEDGDRISLIDYGQHGITVALTYSGEWFDFGFSPDEIPALIKWLQNTQKNRI